MGLHYFHIQDHSSCNFLNFHATKPVVNISCTIFAFSACSDFHNIINLRIPSLPTIIHIKNKINPLIILSRMELSFIIYALSTHEAFHNAIKLDQ